LRPQNSLGNWAVGWLDEIEGQIDRSAPVAEFAASGVAIPQMPQDAIFHLPETS
jgi:hypothetical protein